MCHLQVASTQSGGAVPAPCRCSPHYVILSIRDAAEFPHVPKLPYAALRSHKASWLGVGRGIGNLEGVWSGVFRRLARLHRSLPSSIEPYVRSPLPTPDEQCRSRQSIKMYLRVRLDSKESRMGGGEDCMRRSFVTVAVSGHPRGSEARSPTSSPTAAEGRLWRGVS